MSAMTPRAVDTPHGEARLVTHRARTPFATLLLSHGAGGGIGARDLEALADRLPGTGITVVLLEQPWQVAGRKVATPPPTLDAALVAAAKAAAGPDAAGGRRPLGRRPVRGPVGAAAGRGRLPGARRSRCTRRVGPEKSRLEELRGAGVPTLVVQGERDTMGRPEEFPADLDHVDLRGARRRPRAQVPKRGRRQPGRRAGDHRGVDAGVAGARGGRAARLIRE